MKLRTWIAAALLVAPGMALAAEPIEGNWKTASGSTAAIAKCGGSYCITLKSGKFAGKRIGKLEGSGADYSGSITDPETDKTYSGSAAVKAGSLRLKGCVLAVLCKSQTWSRL
ncbi:DUF2147 domain-containing protein [Shinella sp.]|uniref:DUF2147 domain-containing protein n=1 Tax=Shinella sp. TaxID=1870904 RepID=UPI0028B1C77F|nr:DUF2147 domain-containing protein [Shinella sp.]